MIFSLMMILIFPLVGKIGDIWGMDRAFLFVAILGTISLAWIHINFGYNKRLQIINDKSKIEEEC